MELKLTDLEDISGMEDPIEAWGSVVEYAVGRAEVAKMHDALISKDQGVVGGDARVLQDQLNARRTSNGEGHLSNLERVHHHSFVDDLQFHAMDIMKGLGAAHARGTLHLDLKPGNLLVLPDGTVALADFGLSAIGERADPVCGNPGLYGS